MDFILDHIAQIGIDAVKDRIKDSIMETEAKKRLTEFLKRQKKSCFNCTVDEEMDFEGLFNYIQYDLIEDVKRRLFGDKMTRSLAYKTIVEKAVSYAQSNTHISKQRAIKIVTAAMNVLREYYESKANRELSYYAGRIEDTVINEVSNQHVEISQKLTELTTHIDSTLPLSLDYNMNLADNGQIDKVGENLSKVMKAISTTHPLYPDYGFKLNDLEGKMVSIALSKEAVLKYPPTFNITANNICVGSKNISELQDYDIFNYSYRHQLPIIMDVVDAEKLLGTVVDPDQTEAKKMQGKQVVLIPPQFPKAFPCSISMNGEIVFDYLLMRTKEILDDKTYVITNEEQENRIFDVVFTVNMSSKTFNFNIRPLTKLNAEQLKYRKFIRDASKGGMVSIKALSLNTVLAQGNMKQVDLPEKINLEIEFLQKILFIEHYFQITLSIPLEITDEDHRIIDYIYKIIHSGSVSGYWSSFSTQVKVSEDLKRKILQTDDKLYMFLYTFTLEVELFNQKFSIPMKREIRAAKFQNLVHIKEKAKILDIGDIITIQFAPDMTNGNNTYCDSLDNEAELSTNKFDDCC